MNAWRLVGDNTNKGEEGTAQLYLKYKQANIPVELHIYANTGHGFGLRDPNKGAITQWPEQLRLWLSGLRLFKN